MGAQRSRTRPCQASSLLPLVEMSIEPVQPRRSGSLELSVEELLRRARPLPPHDAMVMDGLSEDEGAAFEATWDEVTALPAECLCLGRWTCLHPEGGRDQRF